MSINDLFDNLQNMKKCNWWCWKKMVYWWTCKQCKSKPPIDQKKFEILQRQKNELEAEYPDQPVFIDVHAEKLYIINDDGFKQFIF